MRRRLSFSVEKTKRLWPTNGLVGCHKGEIRCQGLPGRQQRSNRGLNIIVLIIDLLSLPDGVV